MRTYSHKCLSAADRLYFPLHANMSDSENSRISAKQRTAEAFRGAPSLHPLVVGHMFKQDKNHYTFSKRYFALYGGGMLAYYTHQRDFEEDVKKHRGVPLHCKLVMLDGVYLTRPTGIRHKIKHSFILHAPESSNHRDEFQLVCPTKRDMRVWAEQLQSQNKELVEEEKEVHKTPVYIQKLRLHTGTSRPPSSIEELDSAWLKKASYCPGDIALKFCVNSTRS